MVIMSTVFGSTDHVRVEVKPGALQVENGSHAWFYLHMRTSEGIHINAEPAITIKSVTKGAELSVVDLPKAGDYLDLAKPIKVMCGVNSFTPGQHRVDFILSYTYCSDKEGWCRMGKDSASIEIKVKK